VLVDARAVSAAVNSCNKKCLLYGVLYEKGKWTGLASRCVVVLGVECVFKRLFVPSRARGCLCGWEHLTQLTQIGNTTGYASVDGYFMGREGGAKSYRKAADYLHCVNAWVQ
jgi:hypothetical protein